tara:strand:- start:2965 stop:3693 length:729 start_codon:yes stop_codon:yes gene_type:complete
MKEKIIVQRGWKRTCTNYSRVVLENNFNAKVITSNKHEQYIDYNFLIERTKGYQDATGEIDKSFSGWPHRIQPEIVDELRRSGNIHHVVCIKNPISWLYSMCSMGQHGSLYSDNRPVAELLKEYNDRYTGWKSLIKEHESSTFILRHEDLVCDFENTMKLIQAKFDLRMTYDEIRNENRIVLPQNKGNIKIRNDEFDKNFYINKKYNDMLESKNFRITVEMLAREIVDPSLLSFYGYDSDSF